MEQIYISSTYKDLIDHRQAASRAIKKVKNCVPFGMEAYVSHSERPVHKCLADVRSSQAFILIVAKRYGFIPKDEAGVSQGKSITHLEFEEACRARIPRLVFLLSDRVKDWPQFSDNNPKKTMQFRKDLSNQLILSEFEDISSLENLIEKSLSGLLKEGETFERLGICENVLRHLRADWEKLSYLSLIVDNLRENTSNNGGNLIHPDKIKLTDIYVRQRYRKARVVRNTLVKSKKFQDNFESSKVQATKILEEHRAIVFHGYAGTGKTTLVKHYAISLAKEWLEHGKSIAFPLFLSARTLARRSTVNFEVKVINELEYYVEHYGGLSTAFKVPETFLEKPPPFSGCWLLIIDGLDEIETETQRDALIASIVTYTQRHRDVRVILTSRPLAIFDRPEFQNFEHFVLLPFSPDQIMNYAENWYKTLVRVNAINNLDSKMETKQFVRAIEASKIQSIIHSPVILAFVLAIYTFEEKDESTPSCVLPQGRVELYQRFIDLMSNSALRSKRNLMIEQLMTELLGDSEKVRNSAHALVMNRREILEKIALVSQEDSDENLVDIALTFSIEKKWVDDFGDATEYQSILRNIIRKSLCASGLAIEQGNKIAFPHNTIREFLAAKALSRQIEPSGEATWDLVRRWGDTRWREIVLMLVSMWSLEDKNRNALGKMLQEISLSGGRGAFFAALTLAEGIQLEPVDEDVLIDEIVNYSKQWNPCLNVVSEFQRPNPTDVLMTLAIRPGFIKRIASILAEGGSGCPIAREVLFNFASELRDPDALRLLGNESNDISVACYAYEALAYSGYKKDALCALRRIRKNHGEQSDLSPVYSTLTNIGHVSDLKIIALDPEANSSTRLFACLKLWERTEKQCFAALGAQLVPRAIEDNITYSEDNLAKAISLLLDLDRIKGLLIKRSTKITNKILLCKAHIESGEHQTASRVLKNIVNNRRVKIEDRLRSLRLLQGIGESKYCEAKLRQLSVSAKEDTDDQVTWAFSLGELGEFGILKSVAKNTELAVTYRCRAAEAIAALGQVEFAEKQIREIAMEKNELQRCGRALIEIGEVEDGVAMLCSGFKGGFQMSGGDSTMMPLIELGRSDEIATFVRSPDITFSGQTSVIRALKEICDRRALLDIGIDTSLHPFINLYAYRTVMEMGLEQDALLGFKKIAKIYESDGKNYDGQQLYVELTRNLANRGLIAPDILVTLVENDHQHYLSNEDLSDVLYMVLNDARSRPEEIAFALEKIAYSDLKKIDPSWQTSILTDDLSTGLLLDVAGYAAEAGAITMAKDLAERGVKKLLDRAFQGLKKEQNKYYLFRVSSESQELANDQVLDYLMRGIGTVLKVGSISIGVEALIKIIKRDPKNISRSHEIVEAILSREYFTENDTDSLKLLFNVKKIPTEIMFACAVTLLPICGSYFESIFRNRIILNSIVEWDHLPVVIEKVPVDHLSEKHLSLLCKLFREPKISPELRKELFSCIYRADHSYEESLVKMTNSVCNTVSESNATIINAFLSIGEHRRAESYFQALISDRGISGRLKVDFYHNLSWEGSEWVMLDQRKKVWLQNLSRSNLEKIGYFEERT